MMFGITLPELDGIGFSFLLLQASLRLLAVSIESVGVINTRQLLLEFLNCTRQPVLEMAFGCGPHHGIIEYQRREVPFFVHQVVFADVYPGNGKWIRLLGP